MMSWLNRFVVSHPWLVLWAFLASSAFFGVGLTKLQVDFDIETMFPPEHPEVAYKDWMLDYFEIDEPVMILVENDGPNGVFTPETLELVTFLTDEFEQLEQVGLLDSDDVISISAIDSITGDGDSLTVEPYFAEPPTTQAEADAVRAAVFDNPMMIGGIVNAEGTATIVGADTLPDADKLELHAALKDIIARAPHGSSTLTLAGPPIVMSEMIIVNDVEIRRVLPTVIVTAACVLALTMHSVRGVLLPLMVVLTSILWTFGLMGWTGRIFSTLNSPLPMMLVPIGIADGIHVIHHYMHVAADHPRLPTAEAVFKTMEEMWVAVVMTSITTAAGVASLATSSLSTNQSFGIFSAAGVIAAMVFSLTALPAILVLLPPPRRGLARLVKDAGEEEGMLSSALTRTAHMITERPNTVLAVTAAVVLISITGIPFLTTDGSVLRNFAPTNTVRLANQRLVERFDGSFPIEISVDGGEPDAWKKPENLRALQAFQEELESSDHIGETRSLADYLRRMNAVMNPDDPDGHRIADEQQLIAQYLLLYSISADPDDFHAVVDYDYQIANVRGQVGGDHTSNIKIVLDRVTELEAKHFAPLGLEAHASGIARVSYEFTDLIVESQIYSVTTALALVWLIAALLFRSVLGGLLTAIPVVISTFTTFGGLAWINEPIGITTALMAAIAIGIGIDYAVHFVVRYRDLIRSGATREEAVQKTLAGAGVAIFYNAIVVVAGFLAMATSDFFPPRAMGLMVSWNMVVCFTATVTTLATLLYKLDPAFLRERKSS
jgi:predicted RND superfamily exporter protein